MDNKIHSPRIPREAIALIILNIINFVFLMVSAFMLDDLFDVINENGLEIAIEQYPEISEMISSEELQLFAELKDSDLLPELIDKMQKTVFFLTLLIGCVLLFCTWKIYEGRRWAIIIFLVLGILGLLNSIVEKDIVWIFLDGLTIYFAYFCMKHPFFNQQYK